MWCTLRALATVKRRPSRRHAAKVPLLKPDSWASEPSNVPSRSETYKVRIRTPFAMGSSYISTSSTSSAVRHVTPAADGSLTESLGIRFPPWVWNETWIACSEATGEPHV